MTASQLNPEEDSAIPAALGDPKEFLTRSIALDQTNYDNAKRGDELPMTLLNAMLDMESEVLPRQKAKFLRTSIRLK